MKPQARFLNVACGVSGKNSQDWLNIDGWKVSGIDLALDLRKTLPFESNRFEGIFAEGVTAVPPADLEGRGNQ
ncbi:MAG: hypothetical protein ACKVHE_33065, partial [Planctomycetales bacterium]